MKPCSTCGHDVAHHYHDGDSDYPDEYPQVCHIPHCTCREYKKEAWGTGGGIQEDPTFDPFAAEGVVPTVINPVEPQIEPLVYRIKPYGRDPVQAYFTLADGRQGYYFAKRGEIRVYLWTTPPYLLDRAQVVDLTDFARIALDEYGDDADTADAILRRWAWTQVSTESAAPPSDASLLSVAGNQLTVLTRERDGLRKLVVESAAQHQRERAAWAVERAKLEADLLEAQLEIQALRGEPEGAVGEGWFFSGPLGSWTREDTHIRNATRRGFWAVHTVGRLPWQDGGPVESVRVASGKAPSLREAMRAADRWTP